MAVDQVSNRLVGDFRNRFWNVLGVREWRIYHYNSRRIHHEHGLVTIVGHHVETLAKILNTIPLRRIDRGSFGRFGYWKMLADPDSEWRDSGRVRVRFSRLAWDVLERAGPGRGNRRNCFKK